MATKLYVYPRLAATVTVGGGLATLSEQEAQTAELQDINTELDTQTTALNAINSELDAQTVLQTAISSDADAIRVATESLEAKTASAAVTEAYDYQSFTYVAAGNGEGEVETVTYKLGGSGGATVAVVTLTYDAQNRVSSVTKV